MTNLPTRRNLRFALQVLQVRLRFILLLAVAFFVVSQWERLRTGWDALLGAAWGHPSANESVSPDIEYFCPMDPGVINDWPSICPVCNMVLVRRKRGEMTVLPEGVVARMQFSPYRIQLAGIQTSPIAAKAPVLALTGSSELTECDPPQPDRLRLAVALPRRAARFKLTNRVVHVTTVEIPGIEPCAARVVSQAESTVVLEVDNTHHWLEAGLWATARCEISFSELEPFRSRPGNAATVPTVPESAVVDFGSQRIVYVETQPGMFDGRAVVLGPRCGEEYPVVTGLTAGERVATAGAFLIDAEARLNPGAAASYFGAAGAMAPTAPTVPASTPASTPASDPAPRSTRKALSPADAELVRKQKSCPVTGLPLNAMGGPLPVVVLGRRVFICCAGCEGKLQANPQKYLAKLTPGGK